MLNGHHDAHQQADVAEAGDDEGLGAGVAGLGAVVLVGDQGERTEADDLPEDIQHQEVVGQRQGDHGADEQQREEVVARGRVLLLERLHVLDGVEDRQCADAAGDGGDVDADAGELQREVRVDAGDPQCGGHGLAYAAGDQSDGQARGDEADKHRVPLHEPLVDAAQNRNEQTPTERDDDGEQRKRDGSPLQPPESRDAQAPVMVPGGDHQGECDGNGDGLDQDGGDDDGLGGAH